MGRGSAELLAVLMLACPAAVSAEGLGWLEGARCTQDDDSQTCERWGPMVADTMLGTGQTVRQGRTTGFEFMRISLDGERAVFYGSPAGAPAVAFREVERGGDWIVFENAAHHFPQRIAYCRDGKTLVAVASTLDGGSKIQWRYEPVG